jgi:hypothetical protein
MDIEKMGELFAALAAARLEFGAVTKDKKANIRSDKGASYAYSYADLAGIIEATATALAKNGLVVIQEPEVVSDGSRQLVIIHGCIAHKSGGMYKLQPLPLPVSGSNAQAVGSAISYGRRYQLSAALNLAAADDDGEEASNAPQNAHSATRTTQKAQSGSTLPKRTVDASTGDIEGDVLFEKHSQSHQRFWGIGQRVFGNDWDMARTWLLKQWSKKTTPDNVRTNASDFGDDEKDVLSDYMNETASALQKAWERQKAILLQTTEQVPA